MKVKIQRLFHGYASVRDYQAKEAFAKGEDLEIVLGDKTMRIPHKEILGGQINSTPFKSIHEEGLTYYLVDYPWKADREQTTLL